ncbi:CD209 antigen protein 2 [Biomphalaria glabrata]|nr:CD209 antigen protein 2 [Biomphalaria glabrata]
MDLYHLNTSASNSSYFDTSKKSKADNFKEAAYNNDPPSSDSPSYKNVAQPPHTHPETEVYSRLTSVVNHYEFLPPVQSSYSGSTPAALQKMASKECVCLSVCCIVAGIAVVLATSLATVIVLGNSLEENFNDKFSSLFKLNDDSRTEFLNTIDTICSDCNQTVDADLTIFYLNRCYCLYNKTLSWNSAKRFCLGKGNGVHLAEIYNKETNDFLTTLLRAAQVNQSIWLGGTNLINKNIWLWNYTGIPIEVFEPRQWGDREPTGKVPGTEVEENCLDLIYISNRPYRWNDAPCGRGYIKAFLCGSSPIKSKCLC